MMEVAAEAEDVRDVIAEAIPIGVVGAVAAVSATIQSNRNGEWVIANGGTVHGIDTSAVRFWTKSAAVSFCLAHGVSVPETTTP